MRSMLIALIAATAAGCGASIDLNPLGNCSMQVTLNGTSQTVTCLAGGVSGSTNGVSISMNGTSPDVGSAQFAISLASAPTARTYNAPDVTGAGGAITMKSGNAQWAQGQGQGTFQVILTSVTAIGTQQGSTGYAVRGSASVTLAPVPGTGATGNATITATF